MISPMRTLPDTNETGSGRRMYQAPFLPLLSTQRCAALCSRVAWIAGPAAALAVAWFIARGQ